MCSDPPRPVSPEDCGGVAKRYMSGKSLYCENAIHVEAEAAPPRATTPEPMTEDRYIELGAMHRAGWRGSHAFYYGRRVLSDLYNEVTRLRADAARMRGAIVESEGTADVDPLLSTR